MLNEFRQFISVQNEVESFSFETEGLIEFKSKGLNYAFVYDDKTPNYFRLILPNIYEIKDDKSAVLKVINTTNWRFRVAKAVMVDSEDGAEDGAKVWACFEQFVFSCENIASLFATGVEVLRAIYVFFNKEMKTFCRDAKE